MSHINKIETMQAKMVNAPWYVINEDKEINDKKKTLPIERRVTSGDTLPRPGSADPSCVPQ